MGDKNIIENTLNEMRKKVRILHVQLIYSGFASFIYSIQFRLSSKKIQLLYDSIVVSSTFTQIRARLYVYGNCYMLCACAHLEHFSIYPYQL